MPPAANYRFRLALAAASVVTACAGGQTGGAPPEDLSESRTFKMDKSETAIAMSPLSAGQVDQLIEGETQVYGAVRRCAYWTKYSVYPDGTGRYCKLAAAGWCAKADAEAEPPEAIEGDGWRVEYERGPSTGNQRKSTKIHVVVHGASYVMVSALAPAPREKPEGHCGSGEYWISPGGEHEFRMRPTRGGYVVSAFRQGRVVALQLPEIANRIIPTVRIEDSAFTAESNLTGEAANICQRVFVARAAKERNHVAEVTAPVEPEQNMDGERSNHCPQGWVPLARGLCYGVGRVAYQGVIPIVTLRTWSAVDRASVPVRLSIIEDGQEKCSDEFMLRNLAAGTVTEIRYPCPPTGIVQNPKRVRVVLLAM